GGTWTPPTERALQFMVDNLPQNCVWNASVMNPQKQWPILALAVALGGHVRVGYEDNPYIAPIRQEQCRSGGAHGKHRTRVGARKRPARRGAEDPRARARAVK